MIGAPQRTAGLTAMLLAGFLLLASCAADPSRAEIVESLRKAGVEEPIADCVADAFGELPEADRKLIGERGSNGVRDDFEDPDEPIDVVRRKMSECRNLVPPEPEPTPEPDGESDPAPVIDEEPEGADDVDGSEGSTDASPDDTGGSSDPDGGNGG